jgi:glycine/D-amino acid oxidase-like deaminating enzyme
VAEVELRRRDVLRAAAAAAIGAALPSCAPPRRRIEGRIEGASDARGHLLRDGAATPAGPRGSCEVAIVGGGVAGLSAAWKLAKCGMTDFVLLELEDSVGGTSHDGANTVSRYPWGAHYVPVPTREQRTLCDLLLEMGVLTGFDAAGRAIPVEEHLCRAPEERLFYRGLWTEGLYLRDGATAEDLRQLARFEGLCAALAARRDDTGRRAFAIPVVRSARDADLLALDRISMADWMTSHGLTSPRLLWYADYACRDDFGSRLGGTSAWAGLHYFASRIAQPGDEPAAFMTWPEGNAFLVRHLARSAEGRTRTGAVVTSVEPGDGGATVRYVDSASGEGREIAARRVICALPRFVARRVVAGLARDDEGFRYAPWVVANVTLRSRPSERGFPLAWDNVLYESESLGYVNATHQSDRLGHEDSVWTWYRPYCGADVAAERTSISSKTWEDWRDAVLRDLVPAHRDIEDHVARIDVWRWGHGMVKPAPGFLWGGARERAAAPVGPVHFAGADLGGLPLFEEAQWSGVRAAEEVLAASGRTFETSL